MNRDAIPDLIVTGEQSTSRATYLFGTAPNRSWKVHLSSVTPLATAAPASLAAVVDIYPNPATSQLTLSGSTSLAGQPYTMLDTLSRTVRAGQLGVSEPRPDIQACTAYGQALASTCCAS